FPTFTYAPQVEIAALTLHDALPICTTAPIAAASTPCAAWPVGTSPVPAPTAALPRPVCSFLPRACATSMETHARPWTSTSARQTCRVLHAMSKAATAACATPAVAAVAAHPRRGARR